MCVGVGFTVVARPQAIAQAQGVFWSVWQLAMFAARHPQLVKDMDSHVYAGYTVPPHYDSMVAKLITVGKDRREAIARMSRALSEYMITGIKTTIPFELAVMRDPNFRRGVYATNFIENMLANRRELIERDA